MAAAVPDFQKFISDARERKRNEALANAIFSRGRRQSAPSNLKHTPGGSFASRVGINKRLSSGNWSSRQAGSGNVNGEWTHDLHDSLNHRAHALDARTSHPGPKPGPKRAAASQRRSRLASAVDRMDVDQVNVVRAPGAGGMGMSIRGLAGPFVVIGQNFAPGTTAADIESAVTPVGGEMVSCTILKTSPFLMAEMVFVSREGGERVIETFNDKTADGRLLKLYPRIGGHHSSRASPPNGPRATEQVVDGTMGFSGDRDLMGAESRSSSSSSRPLYSDKIVARGRRGRGYQGGR
ncbi:pentatricopeptide repeat protein [Hirsutella rhossiliensis]